MKAARPSKYSKAAPFGWSACKRGCKWVAYKRDCPEPFDWIPVFGTRREAEAYIAVQIFQGNGE